MVLSQNGDTSHTKRSMLASLNEKFPEKNILRFWQPQLATKIKENAVTDAIFYGTTSMTMEIPLSSIPSYNN